MGDIEVGEPTVSFVSLILKAPPVRFAGMINKPQLAVQNPSVPLTLRIASPCTEPASRFPPPGPTPVQARKGERQGKNPFLFAMLFEKNIETFFERQPFAAICLFLPPPAFPSLGAGRRSGGGVYARGHHTQSEWRCRQYITQWGDYRYRGICFSSGGICNAGSRWRGITNIYRRV